MIFSKLVSNILFKKFFKQNVFFFPPVLEVIWHQLSDSLWGTWADREVSNRRAAAGVVQGVGCQDQRVGLESSAQHVLGFSAVKCHGLQALKHHKLVYCLYNWLIYSLKWWFSIVMLVYQRVVLKILVGGLEHLDYFSIYIYIHWECHHPNWLILFGRVGIPPTR